MWGRHCLIALYIQTKIAFCIADVKFSYKYIHYIYIATADSFIIFLVCICSGITWWLELVNVKYTCMNIHHYYIIRGSKAEVDWNWQEVIFGPVFSIWSFVPMWLLIPSNPSTTSNFCQFFSNCQYLLRGIIKKLISFENKQY